MHRSRLSIDYASSYMFSVFVLELHYQFSSRPHATHHSLAASPLHFHAFKGLAASPASSSCLGTHITPGWAMRTGL